MDIYRKIVELIDGGIPLAVVLVLSAKGSTPQCAGARAIVEQSGRLWGTVGGGMVEAKAQRMAAEACQSQRPSLFDCDMQDLDAAVDSAVCGGSMRVLVDPAVARHRSCFAEAAGALASRRRGWLLTRIRTVPDVEVEV
ncbi:MAG: XdhC family protein [Thermoguttaceae bacterium]